MKINDRYRLYRSRRKARLTVRQGYDWLCRQRDLLDPEAVQSWLKRLQDVSESGKAETRPHLIEQKIRELDREAESLFKQPGHMVMHDNLEIVLAALVLTCALRCFFGQPISIPTGSMQPTLYGIRIEDHRRSPKPIKPGNGLQSTMDRWLRGIRYFDFVGKSSGYLEILDPEPVRSGLGWKQDLKVNSEVYTLENPPSGLLQTAGIYQDMYVAENQPFIRFKHIDGDHVLVNRLKYNLRRPRRGDIVVFKSNGIPGLNEGEIFIKRLVALAGDTVRIGRDRRVRINGVPLDEIEPVFAELYDFDPNLPPMENAYSGHVNQEVGIRHGAPEMLSPLFKSETDEFHVSEGHCLVFGDNTMLSQDSRFFGEIPLANIIGMAGLVYWPVSERLGKVPR